MPILTYCVALASEAAIAPETGIATAPVLALQEYGLECWYSDVEEKTFSGAEQVQRAALEFHRFVSTIFASATVLPFRFPTILDSVEELRDHLDEKANWYATVLERIDGLAQFEARLVSKVLAPANAESGTAYLEEKKQALDGLRRAEAAVIRGLEDFVRGSHVKEAPGGLRLYLLSEKRNTGEMRDAIKGISLPAGFEVRFSGPWPATEFLPAEEDV